MLGHLSPDRLAATLIIFSTLGFQGSAGEIKRLHGNLAETRWRGKRSGCTRVNVFSH